MILMNDYPNNYNYGYQDIGNISMLNRIDIYNLYIWYGILIVVLIMACLYTVYMSMKYISIYININIDYHNIIEIIYTILPCIILIIIFIPSIRLIYIVDNIGYINTYLNIIGYQWYWVYSIMEYNSINVDITSYTVSTNINILENYIEVDNIIILPSCNKIRLLLTGGDIIHSFAIISLGFKIDCIPGRINSIYIYVIKNSNYIGYCSELCGSYHNNMNIILSFNEYTYYYCWLTTIYYSI